MRMLHPRGHRILNSNPLAVLQMNPHRFPQDRRASNSEDALKIFQQISAGKTVKYAIFTRTSAVSGNVMSQEMITRIEQFFKDCEKAGIHWTFSTIGIKPETITAFN